MRNLVQYPPGKDEIVETLRNVGLQMSIANSDKGIMGDIKPLMLYMAADIVRRSSFPTKEELLAHTYPATAPKIRTDNHAEGEEGATDGSD